MSRRPNWHPLLTFFLWRGFSEYGGFHWLYVHGWISDLCTDIYTISSVDVERVLIAARVRHFFPVNLAPLCKRPDATK